MKRSYTKPTIEGEQFSANEYIAACWIATYTLKGTQYTEYLKDNPTEAQDNDSVDSYYYNNNIWYYDKKGDKEGPVPASIVSNESKPNASN